MGDAAVVISGDAFPLANRHVAQPVIVSFPIRTAGGVVEGDQRLPFRFGRGLCAIGGRAVGRGVLMGKTLCIVGAAVAAGVGSAALAVGEKEPAGGVA